MTADGLSTALMVMGIEQGMKFAVKTISQLYLLLKQNMALMSNLR